MNNLAYSLRPKTLADVVGQQHLLEDGKLLDRMVKANRLSSLLLYGPPGIGKTTIARALAGSAHIPYREFNASTDAKRDLQAFAKEINEETPQLLIIVDEIHRLNKPNQDFLLPYMEDGSFVVVGATTENPHISVNPAIRSRSQILELKPLQPKDLLDLLEKGIDYLEDHHNLTIKSNDDDLLFLARTVNGDGRKALNTLELVVLSSVEGNHSIVTKEALEESLGVKDIGSDKDGDGHYDVISAFQKSLRGSDVNASLHYLARILESGDLTIATRRLRVTAFEDVGLADIEACLLVEMATQAALEVGLPEARIPLAVATVNLALAPKSNSAYAALDQAAADLNQTQNLTIPTHLHDTHYQGAGDKGYKFPHTYPHHWVKQDYLPKGLKGKIYWGNHTPQAGHENRLVKRAQGLYDLQNNQGKDD